MKPTFKPLIAVLLIGLFYSHNTLAQSSTPTNVAIFLYEGVELLDFAGPGEVFSASGFKVYTMSVDGKELVSQRFVTIKPQYSIDNAPAPDIIVFPGGDTAPTANNAQVIEWVKKRRSAGTFLMSVCTGASVLAKADQLNGLNVTTFHGFIPGLQAMLPTSKVLEHTRFVDNGTIITTAGVSAGIDGALHLVSRIKGIDEAKATAYYMEYDKWNPADGRVDRKNDLIERLRAELNKPEKEVKTFLANISASKEQLPYEGELRNLAFELRDNGSYQQAAYVLEAAIKLYPTSSRSYPALAGVYTKLGKSAPTTEAVFIKMIDDGKVDEALLVYENDRKAFPEWKMISEDQLNYAGYRLLQKEDFTNAIKVFQLNVRANPNSFNVFDSLGEAYMMSGKKNEAVTNYKKSLELNPANDNARQMLTKMEAK